MSNQFFGSATAPLDWLKFFAFEENCLIIQCGVGSEGEDFVEIFKITVRDTAKNGKSGRFIPPGFPFLF